MNTFRFSIFSLFLLTLFFSSASAQDCMPYTANTDGTISINFATEIGECFEVNYRGSSITPQPVSYLTFHSSPGLQKVKVTMANGNVIEKKLALSQDQASVVYEIKKNRKGKYSLKMQLLQGGLTADAQQRQNDEMNKFQEEQKAKEEARKAKSAEEDAKWEADRAADRERMKEYVKIDSPEEPVEEVEEGVSDKGNATATTTETQTATTTETKSSSGPSKTYGTGKNEFAVQIMYKDVPITQTQLTITINKVVLGAGLTDDEGVVTMRTDYDIPSSIPIDIKGEKGSTEWSMEGFFLLNEPPKGTLLQLDHGVKQMADMMGISGSQLAQMWGFE